MPVDLEGDDGRPSLAPEGTVSSEDGQRIPEIEERLLHLLHGSAVAQNRRRKRRGPGCRKPKGAIQNLRKVRIAREPIAVQRRHVISSSGDRSRVRSGRTTCRRPLAVRRLDDRDHELAGDIAADEIQSAP